MVKLAYITPGGTVHDERWLAKLREHFDVTTLLDKPVDIIQTGPIGGITYSMVRYAQRLGAKLVLMSWGFDVLENEITPAVEESIDYADMFLCDSDVVREKLLSLRMPPPPPILQIPWGVDLEMFRPAPLRKWTRQRAFWLIQTRERGAETLLKVWDKIPAPWRNMERIVWWWIGKSEYDAMPTKYNRADAYICASPSDGTSVSLLEAMACGLPVIVADAPGNREWVTQGVNGWLCEIGNAQSFADAIVECVNMTPTERREMGERNRAVVEARANWHKNFGRVVEAYHELATK
jgi:glycosyltransferase involved in cell wall biosynthesis